MSKVAPRRGAAFRPALSSEKANEQKSSPKKTGSISSCFRRQKSKSSDSKKYHSKNLATRPPVFDQKFLQKWGAFPPFFFIKKSAQVKWPEKFLQKNGQHFPLLYSKKCTGDMARKIPPKKWAAFPPVEFKKCTGDMARKIPPKKWAAFPPVLFKKSAQVTWPEKFLQKNGQHFPLLYSKMQR